MDKPKLKHVYFCANGNVACFDDQGRQVTELQKDLVTLWLQHAEQQGYSAKDLSGLTLSLSGYPQCGDFQIKRCKDPISGEELWTYGEAVK